jgi:hypothetical protein
MNEVSFGPSFTMIADEELISNMNQGYAMLVELIGSRHTPSTSLVNMEGTGTECSVGISK